MPAMTRLATHVLYSPWERATAALFRESLEGRILVWGYAISQPHIFCTFFCPPMQIIGLDRNGQLSYSRNVQPNRFVRLERARCILATDPSVPSRHAWKTVLRRYPDLEILTPGYMGCGEAGLDGGWLMYLTVVRKCATELKNKGEQLLSVSNKPPEAIRSELELWEQGSLLASADVVSAYASDIEISISPRTMRLAERIAVLKHTYSDVHELYAAAVACGALPAHLNATKSKLKCIRCLINGKQKTANCKWKYVLQDDRHVPPEARWRYERPENLVPVCGTCGRTLLKTHERRVHLGLGIWGARFAALLRWHNAARRGTLPAAWDKQMYPLWPDSFGGDTWETGSGAWTHIDMRRPTGVSRSEEQLRGLATLLKCSPYDLPTPLVTFGRDSDDAYAEPILSKAS